MLAQIETLALLQTVDREIREQKGRKQNLLGELDSKEKAIQLKKREIEALVASANEKEKLRAEKDRVWQDEGKKAVEKRMRMNRIKNVKELQAVQREIDSMRQANGELEEELIRIMQELQEASQLIVITHQKRTMEVADALYGVSMQGDGVSKVISQRLRQMRGDR